MCSGSREKLEAQVRFACPPLREADLEYWTDGSCYRVGDKLSAGYAVVKAQEAEFVVENAEVIPQPASAQLAELVGNSNS